MQKGFFQMERYYTTVTSLNYLGLLVYNASMPNKRDALLWWAIQCIKVTPYTKSYTNIRMSEFLIIPGFCPNPHDETPLGVKTYKNQVLTAFAAFC